SCDRGPPPLLAGPAPPPTVPPPLHDALPICRAPSPTETPPPSARAAPAAPPTPAHAPPAGARRMHSIRLLWRTSRAVRRSSLPRSEEHTSELQSRENLVCRLLLEKKKRRKRA